MKGSISSAGRYAVGKIGWTATGGAVDDQGVFSAGPDEGNFIVTAETDEASVTGSVSIADEAEPPRAEPTTKQPTRLTWSGEMPPQKWTNFYMKVLTKLVSGGNLRLNVAVEAVRSSGVTEQLIEEMKAALRGLGLQHDVSSD